MTDNLDDLLVSARDATPVPDALMTRVLADAARVQAEAAVVAAPVRRPRASWLSMIGGWRGAGGLVAATVTGLMVGIAAPDSIDTLLGGQLADYGLVESDSLLPGWGGLLDFEEG